MTCSNTQNSKNYGIALLANLMETPREKKMLHPKSRRWIQIQKLLYLTEKVLHVFKGVVNRKTFWSLNLISVSETLLPNLLEIC